MDPMNLQQNNVVHVNDFINLIRGENEDPIYNFGSGLLNDCFSGNSIFDQNNNVVNGYDPNSTLSSFSCFGGKVKGEGEGEGEEENCGIYSSSKTTITTIAIAGNSSKAKSRPKTDRSKTLITERRRRGQMKEKLYALRSLVPNITKMDKASIIGDAVEYVHNLQAQANKLKAEIAGLEISTLVYESYQGSSSIDNPLKILVTNNSPPISKMIMQINMYQVEEKGYHGKIVCNKGQGVAASLYKALESLAGFKVQNSNLFTVCDTLILTFTLNVKGSDPEINLQNLKLWVTGALLNQGFEFMAFALDA